MVDNTVRREHQGRGGAFTLPIINDPEYYACMYVCTIAFYSSTKNRRHRVAMWFGVSILVSDQLAKLVKDP